MFNYYANLEISGICQLTLFDYGFKLIFVIIINLATKEIFLVKVNFWELIKNKQSRRYYLKHYITKRRLDENRTIILGKFHVVTLRYWLFHVVTKVF